MIQQTISLILNLIRARAQPRQDGEQLPPYEHTGHNKSHSLTPTHHPRHGRYRRYLGHRTTLITLITYPIATSLFPAFSKLTTKQDHDIVEKMFKLSVKYISLLVILTSLAIALFSKQLIHILYGLQYQQAPTYLTIYILTFLSAGLGMFIVGNLFNGQGDTGTALRINLVNLSLSAPLAFILTSLYGVPGLLASILTSQLLSTTNGLFLARKKYAVIVDATSSIRMMIASLCSTLLVYIFITLVPTPIPILKLAVGGSLFVTSFLAFAPLLRVIDKEDINNLDELVKELVPIYPIARRILNLEKKILSLSVTRKA